MISETAAKCIIIAVSYTHLVQAGELALLGELGTEDVLNDPVVQRAMVLELQTAHTAVSYTHLDVYKRQVRL